MSRLSVRNDTEPIETPVTDTNAGAPEGLGNDDVIDRARSQQAGLREMRHAGETAALFVDSRAHLEAADQGNIGTAQGFRSVDCGSQAALHIGTPSSVEPPVLDRRGEWLPRPPRACRDDVN